MPGAMLYPSSLKTILLGGNEHLHCKTRGHTGQLWESRERKLGEPISKAVLSQLAEDRAALWNRASYRWRPRLHLLSASAWQFLSLSGPSECSSTSVCPAALREAGHLFQLPPLTVPEEQTGWLHES